MDSRLIKQTWGEETAGSGHLSETSCTVSLAPACTPQDSRVTDEGMNEPQLGEGTGGGEHESQANREMSRWKVKLGLRKKDLQWGSFLR